MGEMESRNDSVVRPGRRGMTMTTATTTTLSLGSSAMWMLLLLLWLTVWTGPCQGENTTNVTTTLAPSAVPSSLPSSHHTLAPSPPARNVTTAAPSSSWTPPSAAPSHANNNSSNVTNAPTPLPHSSPTATPTGSKPSSAPSRPPPPPPSASPTATPTAPPSSLPTSPAPPTIAPTAAPTEKYNPTPTDDHQHQHQHHHNDGHKGFSVWRILAKTLGWLILIALSVLLFGAIMSNRYQILYTLRMWGRAFLQWHGTQWFLEKTRLNRWIGGSSSGSGALNDVIFDRGDLSEGLLLSRNDE